MLTVDFLNPNAAKQLSKSLLETGFAVVVNHLIDSNLVFDTYQSWQDFFASDYRNQYLFDEKSQTGFIPFERSETAKGYEHPDLKEFFSYYDWGPCPPRQSELTRRLRDDMLVLADVLLRWIEQEMPPQARANLTSSLTDMIKDSPVHMMRIIHYPPLSGSETSGAVRAAAHEDINFITLLPTATAPGLEVQDLGGNWHALECDPGSIIVNTAEMLQIATNGYYKATTHRVVNPSGDAAKQARYSMPFFLHPKRDQFLTRDRTAQDFLDVRLKELGLLTSYFADRRQ